MALRLNPVTGQMQDDGLPVDPNAVAPIEVPPPDFQFGGAGGAAMAPPVAAAPAPVPVVAAAPAVAPSAPGGVNVQVGPATKPIREVEATQREKTPEIVAAENARVAAQGATDEAAAKVSGIEQQERQIESEGANSRAATKQRLLEHAQNDERDRQARVEANMAADAKTIEEEKQARLAAGNPEKSFWEGRPVAKFFTRILQVVGGVAHGLAGKDGPSAVDQALSEEIEAHRRKLVNAWEATKEANALKKTNRAAHDAESDRRAIVANNQSLAQLDIIDEQMKARIAALGKDKQAAADQLKTATLNEQRAAIKVDSADRWGRVLKTTDNTYDPNAAAAAKPLSTEAKEIAGASAEYERLAARQQQLLDANNGYPSLGTPDRTEFDTNNRAMATILQKPLGKSDADAAAAKDLQNSPGFWTQALNTDASQARYRTALRVNSVRLRKAAETAASLEGQRAPASSAPAAAAAPNGGVRKAVNGKPAMVYPDGTFEYVK